MSSGIYCYRDLNNHGKIVYIGKDSHIDNNLRHKQHLQLSQYNKQPFNRILQNNSDRYEYEVILKGDISEKLLNAYEKVFIRRYNPKFNFTRGGDGFTGKHTEETKRKLSENNAKYWEGKTLSEETKRKMSEAKKNKYASIVKNGKNRNNKQVFAINKNGKIIKHSINPSKLLDWFTKEFPKEILQIKINMEE